MTSLLTSHIIFITLHGAHLALKVTRAYFIARGGHFAVSVNDALPLAVTAVHVGSLYERIHYTVWYMNVKKARPPSAIRPPPPPAGSRRPVRAGPGLMAPRSASMALQARGAGRALWRAGQALKARLPLHRSLRRRRKAQAMFVGTVVAAQRAELPPLACSV